MKTKSILGLVALLALVVAMPNIMLGAPSACSAITGSGALGQLTYQDLEMAGSCYIQVGANNFLVFSGFTDSEPTAASGAGKQVNPEDIGVTVIPGTPTVTTGPNGTGTGGVQDIYGFNFNPSLDMSMSGGVGFDDVDLTYNVTAETATGTDINEIDSVHELITASILPSGSALAESAETDTGCNTVTGCSTVSPAPLIVNEPTPPGTAEADYVGIGPYATLSVDKDITLTAYSANSSANISSVVDGVDLLSSVPEPASLAYLALGCLGLLGAARRRKQNKV